MGGDRLKHDILLRIWRKVMGDVQMPDDPHDTFSIIEAMVSDDALEDCF